MHCHVEATHHRACTLVQMILVTLMFSAASVFAALPENEACLNCHGQKDVKSGVGTNVYIDPVKFAATTHSIVGCTSCHDRVSSGHPRDGSAPSRAICGDCHGPIFKEYSKSLHASKARCNDCHDPHEVRLPVFMSGDEINSKCARCHNSRKILLTHSKWLPQADLHIDALLCITCHTGSQDYVITMSIESRLPGSENTFKLATFEELSKLIQSGDIDRVIDLNGDSIVSLDELRTFNHNLRGRNMRLWGMMTPEIVTLSYQILNNRYDCSFCHASGPKAMQKSFISFPDKNGGYTRLAVEKGAILDILYGTPDFYMLGSTRSTALNIVGALIVAVGLSLPVGHGFFRLLTRKNRKGMDHEA
ncbi:MAG: multiheme c-type cytochrome [Desulfuromonadaceae bacterium]|nr:multiheme c-type cytochrome [Desulfuromonadaceae bacterium]